MLCITLLCPTWHYWDTFFVVNASNHVNVLIPKARYLTHRVHPMARRQVLQHCHCLVSLGFTALGDATLHPASLRKGVFEIKCWKRRFQALMKMACSEEQITLFFPTLRVQLGKLVLVRWAHHRPP